MDYWPTHSDTTIKGRQCNKATVQNECFKGPTVKPFFFNMGWIAQSSERPIIVLDRVTQRSLREAGTEAAITEEKVQPKGNHGS